MVGCFSISFPSGADQPPPSRCRFMDKKLSCECRPPGAPPGPEFSLPRVSAPGRGVKGLRGRGGAPSPPLVSVPPSSTPSSPSARRSAARGIRWLPGLALLPGEERAQSSFRLQNPLIWGRY